MTENIQNYAKHFFTGMRIGVELPLPNGKIFRDDAIISYFSQDLLELQLSRNLLPEEAIMEAGADLYLRTGKKGSGYRCRAILLRCDSLSRFTMRLAGEVLPFDQREFFRIDVFIPLTYCLHFASVRHEDGETRLTGISGQGETPAEIDMMPEEPLPVAANLSGAGVRINIPQRFKIDDLLDLTLHLQASGEKTMTLLGQVVYVRQLGHSGDPRPLYATALRFLSIDEPKRDSLLKFIHRAELEQLRRLREQSLNYSRQVAETEEVPFFSRTNLLRIFYAISIVVVFACIILALVNYRRSGVKGEIEKTFEDQIKKYIER